MREKRPQWHSQKSPSAWLTLVGPRKRQHGESLGVRLRNKLSWKTDCIYLHQILIRSWLTYPNKTLLLKMIENWWNWAKLSLKKLPSYGKNDCIREHLESVIEKITGKCLILKILICLSKTIGSILTLLKTTFVFIIDYNTICIASFSLSQRILCSC